MLYHDMSNRGDTFIGSEIGVTNGMLYKKKLLFDSVWFVPPNSTACQ